MSVQLPSRLGRIGVREYLISPLLVSTVPWPSYAARQEVLRGNSLDASSSSNSSSSSTKHGPSRTRSLPSREDPEDAAMDEERVTLRRVRNNRLLDSALAGGLTGGGISAMFRESRQYEQSLGPRLAKTTHWRNLTLPCSQEENAHSLKPLSLLG